MKAKCVECSQKGLNLPAEFVLLDEVVNQLKPLCDQHLQEYLTMFGEVDTTFCHIENDAEILRMTNLKLAFLTKQYTTLLQEEK